MSSPSTTPPSIRIRKRAATKVLLGSDYEEVIRTTPSPPVPMEKAEEYTLSRVKAGLLYADNILRNTIRKLSPLGQRALALYKENCATLLDLGEGELNENGEDAETLKLQLIAQIRSYEADLQYHGFMKLLPPANDQDLIDKILHLKRVEFYARYGDILARFCTKLKVAANVNKTPGHRMLMAYWTKTEKELNDELTSFNAYRRGEVEKGSECKTTLAVYHACRHIGIEFDDMRSIISMYATQNSMLHEDLDNLVRGKRYHSLAKRLAQDYRELTTIIPPAEASYLNLIQTLIDTLIDGWYSCDKSDRDNEQSWIPKEELIKAHEALCPQAQEREEQRRVQWARMDEAFKAKLANDAKQRKVSMQALAGSTTPALSQVEAGKKRVASRDLDMELRLAKKRQTQWDTIIWHQARANSQARAYLAAWGSMEPPPVPVLDPSLDPDTEFDPYGLPGELFD